MAAPNDEIDPAPHKGVLVGGLAALSMLAAALVLVFGVAPGWSVSAEDRAALVQACIAQGERSEAFCECHADYLIRHARPDDRETLIEWAARRGDNESQRAYFSERLPRLEMLEFLQRYSDLNRAILRACDAPQLDGS